MITIYFPFNIILLNMLKVETTLFVSQSNSPVASKYWEVCNFYLNEILRSFDAEKIQGVLFSYVVYLITTTYSSLLS